MKKKSIEHNMPQPLIDDNSARTRLIDASAALFAEHGLDGVSTRDIAKASGLNISLISYYFGGKEGLYKAVIVDFAMKAYGQFQSQIASYDAGDLNKKTFSQMMKKMIQATVAMKLQSPYICKILQREILSGLPFARDVHENVFSEIAQKLVGFMLLAQSKGIMKKEINPNLLFISLIHATDAYVVSNQCSVGIMKFCPKLPEESDLYCEHIYKIFIEGALL